MSSAPAIARQLLERTGDHPVISLYFDLDRDEFATAPARATQARALIDEANRIVEADKSLDHHARSSLASDVSRLDEYLASDDLPVSGVRALAIFSSRETDLFETVTLSRPTASNVFISRNPHVEPLVVQGDDEHWCAVLVTSRTGHVYRGKALQITAEEKIEDYVRGHSQGGAAGENTQGQDIEGHLRNLAQAIYHDWQREPFSLLALSGPVESAARLQELLHNDLRPTLATSHLDVDAASATASDLEAAIAEVLDAKRQADAGRALEALTETTRAVTGPADTLQALNERRVGTLLLSRDFTGSGGRCPSCGLLVTPVDGSCPADGTPIDPVTDLREAAVQAALVQDAAVIAFGEPQDELGPTRPIAALLRF